MRLALLLVLTAGQDFADLPLEERRAEAQRRVAEVGAAGAAQLTPLAQDSDPAIRRLALEWVDRPDLMGGAIEDRVAMCARMIEEDPSAALREVAREALARIDRPESVAAIERLLPKLDRTERAHLVAALPATERSARVLEGLLLDEQTSADVVVAALPTYGRLLAEGVELSVDPLITGLSHPDERVALATATSYVSMVGRMRALERGEMPRALSTLDQLVEAGLDRVSVLVHRASLSIFPAVDPEGAIEAARTLRGGMDGTRAAFWVQELHSTDRAEAELWLLLSYYYEGLGLLSLGEHARADAALEQARRAGLRTVDSTGASGDAARLDRAEIWQHRALVEVARVLVRLAAGEAPGDPEVVRRASEAHRCALEAQVLFSRVHGDWATGWDDLLNSELSPYRLIFPRIEHPGMTMAESLALQEALGVALAGVCADEMPGFAPPEGVDSDPLEDPVRRALLEEASVARLDGVSAALDRVNSKVMRRGGTGWEQPEELLEERNRLQWRLSSLQREFAGADFEESLRELRRPCSAALWLARDLREEGHGAEARRVARALQKDLGDIPVSSGWYYHGKSLIVRSDLVIGSAYTDDDEPLRAEEALLAAVRRIEALDQQLISAGVDPGAFSDLEATAYVSLAVNANVKLGDKEKALGYYERAYELRQDEFMTVLLACYRARSGRPAEARELIRRVRPSPQTWYNLACTHALLGDTDEALRYLEIEIEGNHPSEDSKRRQRAWARSDPDLASLRSDPRFEALVGWGAGK